MIKPKLLDQVRNVIRYKHYSIRTEESYVHRYALKKELGLLENVTRAKKPAKLPVVFTQDEIKNIVVQLNGVNWLMANLLYGAGLRLRECLQLRVKDVDFGYKQIVVRDGKGVLSPGDTLFLQARQTVN